MTPPDRELTPELMDDPDLSPRMHRAALGGLARLNLLSLAGSQFWPEIRRIASSRPGPVTLLDIATGSGDVPIRLARRAARAGITVNLHACDLSPVAIDAIRERASKVGIPVDAWVHDVVASPIGRKFDIVTCGLFLHHLTEASAVALLRNAAAAARGTFLLSDLRRDRTGLVLAWIASRLCTTSPIVHTDALKSVRAAFTISELHDLATAAGLDGASIRPVWPRRMLLTWRSPATTGRDSTPS